MKTYKELATELGQLVDDKNKAYGSSFQKAGDVFRVLYPAGVKPEQYDDFLALTRIVDKLFRIATARDAFGESPYGDIVGYGLLGLKRHNEQRSKVEEPKDAAEVEAVCHCGIFLYGTPEEIDKARAQCSWVDPDAGPNY